MQFDSKYSTWLYALKVLDRAANRAVLARDSSAKRAVSCLVETVVRTMESEVRSIL